MSGEVEIEINSEGEIEGEGKGNSEDGDDSEEWEDDDDGNGDDDDELQVWTTCALSRRTNLGPMSGQSRPHFGTDLFYFHVCLPDLEILST